MGLAASLAVAILAGPASALKEATLYYVNTHSSSSGGCSGSNFSWGDDTVDYLADKLDGWGWDRVYEHSNQWLDFRDVADVDEDSGGNDSADPAGVDSADLGMVYSHGGVSGCDEDAAYSYMKMGDAATECKVRYGALSSQNDVWWGDTDLNIMIIDTCKSLQKCAFDDQAYFVASNNMGALLGFHGISYDSRNHTNNFEDFVDDSRYNGLGDNWVDEMTYRWIGWNNDECGTAVTFGATESDCDFVYQWGGLEDWKSISSHAHARFYYIEGCNPDGGNKL
jgi:hypothetical protein